MHILFIADPMAGFKTYKDTTYAMMREMAARGWRLSHTLSAELSVQNGQVVAVHGGTRQYAGQNRIVVLNRGHADGLERGHVLALAKRGATLNDNTDPAHPAMTLPDERNGVMLVFRTFEHLSYALVLHINDSVRAGDRFSQP